MQENPYSKIFTETATHALLPQEKILPLADPTRCALFIQMRFNGVVLSSGTAFVMQAPSGQLVLITNRHNVTGRRQDTGECLSTTTAAVPNEVLIQHHHEEMIGKWLMKVETLYENNIPRWIEHPTLGEKADFVALPLRNLADTTTFSWSVEPVKYEQAIAPAETVSVVGFPFGLAYEGFYPIWATGFVASEPRLDYGGLPVFLIDSRTRQGQSGSPVVKHSNGGTILLRNGASVVGAGQTTTWLGIYSGRIHGESDIGMVWKKEAILELVNTL